MSRARRYFLPGSSISGAGNVIFGSVSGGAFNVNGTYTPAGVTTLNGDMTVNFNTPVSLPALVVTNDAGGAPTLGGSGDVIVDLFAWNKGTIVGSGVFRTRGVGEISGNFAKSVSGRAWDNTGFTTMAGGTITVSSNFTNPGTVNLGTTLQLNRNFDNAGILNLIGGTLKAGSAVTSFSNSGLVKGNGSIDVSREG